MLKLKFPEGNERIILTMDVEKMYDSLQVDILQVEILVQVSSSNL